MRRFRKTAGNVLLCLLLAASMMPVSVFASSADLPEPDAAAGNTAELQTASSVKAETAEIGSGTEAAAEVQAELMADEWNPLVYHYVVNDITEDTTWKSGETYVVCMHMDEWKESEVAPGATLTVQAGARIILGMDSAYRRDDSSPTINIAAEMPVRGTLIIQGTEDKPVTVSGWLNDGVHPQGFDGFSLQPGSAGGTVKADIRYCNFTGGGAHHNFRTGLITYKSSKDEQDTEQEQAFQISLDHCLFRATASGGGEEPGYAPVIATSLSNPDRWPAEIKITNCTFGTPEGPVGAAVVDDCRSNQHRYTIRNCRFENCRKCWDGSVTYRAVLSFSEGGSSPLFLENCTFVTDPTLPEPVMTGYGNKNVWGYTYYDDAGEKREGWHSMLDEKCGFGHIENCTFEITSATSCYLPQIMSGVPIRKLDIQKETVRLYDNGPGESNFELKIEPGGSLNIAEGAKLKNGDGSTTIKDNVFMLTLGKGAIVSGLDLYESDGQTTFKAFPTAQEETFTWQYSDTSRQYQERMNRYTWEKNKWVRREGYVRPASIAFDQKEITLTVPANANADNVFRKTFAPILTAKVSPANADDTEVRFVCAETQRGHFSADSGPKAYMGWDNLSYMPFTDDYTTSENGEWSMDADQIRFYADSAFAKSDKDRMDFTLYAYTRDGGILTEEPCLIHIVKGPEAVYVTGVSADPSEAELNVGGTVSLKPVFTPENPTSQDVYWTSSNSDIAAVDASGLVTAKKKGFAYIYVISKDGGKRGTCRITVNEGGSSVVPVTGVSLNKTESSIAAGGNESLKAVVAPTGASNQKVNWSSSDPAVAAVDASGKVSGKKPGTATITVTTQDGGKTASCRVRVLFTDVTDSKSFFFEPVYWAVEKGVTNGKTETTFAPGDTCTRGQVVTFLWRAAGSPEPKSSGNPFTDVKSDAFYYKAVLWAVENKITNGLSETTFGPGTGCTRGQVVTFLHRAKGSPAEYASISFTDVPSNAFYYNAVRWAVKAGVTSGTSESTFSPGSSCTRGQIVTFLSRAYAE